MGCHLGRCHRCRHITWSKTPYPLPSCARVEVPPSRPLTLVSPQWAGWRKNVSQEKGNFLLPKETPDHIFNHLSFQRASRLGHLEVIIEANLFFDIFYWIFSSLIQTWKDYDPIMWPINPHYNYQLDQIFFFPAYLVCDWVSCQTSPSLSFHICKMGWLLVARSQWGNACGLFSSTSGAWWTFKRRYLVLFRNMMIVFPVRAKFPLLIWNLQAIWVSTHVTQVGYFIQTDPRIL